MLALLSFIFVLQIQSTGLYPPASQSEYLIRHYDIEDGLPVNAINGIVQNEEGYLYFATYDGLARYDGYEFDIYNSGNSPGIITNRQAGIIQASDGTLWIFNEGGTITSKKGSVFKTFTTAELPGQATRLIESKSGKIWVSGTNGLAFFSPEEGLFRKLEHPLLQTKISVLVPGMKDEIYLQTDKGIYIVEQNIPKLILEEGQFSFPGRNVRDFELAGENKLWVIGITGAFLFNISENSTEYTSGRNIYEISYEFASSEQLNAGTIITDKTGYYLLRKGEPDLRKLEVPFNPEEMKLSLFLEGSQGEEILVGIDVIIIDNQIVLQGPLVKYVHIDKEGSFWMGSEASGLYQIRKSSFTNISTQQIPDFVNVYSIIENQNEEIWACSFTSGVFQLIGNEYKLWNRTNSALPSNQCKFLYIDTDGSTYSSLNDAGLWKLEEGTWRQVMEMEPFLEGHNSSIEAMHRQGEKLLVANFNSLVVLEDNEFRFFDESAPRELSGIQVFIESSKGIIFAGTAGNGLSRIEGESFRTYTSTDGVLNSDTIRDIFLQSEDTLWVINESLGLNRLVFNKQGDILATASVTVKDGLSQNSLHRLIDDGLGYFWISGNSGIMRISKKELNKYANGENSELRVLSFNEKDGMINREANGGAQSSGIRASDGRLWFSNLKGITIIDPTDFSVDQGLEVPPPVFETIELNEENLFISGLNEISIPNRQRDLRVNFTVPNFVNQDRINFSYRLDGVNEQWQNATASHQAVFTGIPSGKHELRIRSQFIGGDEVESSIMITIPSYFYETNWFRILLIFGLIGLVYSTVRIRVRSLKETERKLKERVDIQTKELKEAAEQKQRFFTGITHELKTPLSLIISPLDDLVESQEGKLDKTVSDRLSMMQRNSYRLKNLVDQILDVSKLNADAIKMKMQPARLSQLTRQIAGQFQSKLEQEEISINIPTKEFSEYIYVDVEAWERIIINLISNAIKFSPKKSTIDLCFKEHESTIEVILKDRGLGIAPEYQEKVFEYLYQVEGNKASEGTGIGLYLVKGLVERMGGSIRLNSEPGKGAEFTITLNKGHAHIQGLHEVIHEPAQADEKPLISPIRVEPEPTMLENTRFEHQVLVVEDNFDFRMYLKSILEKKHKVFLAENGKEALTLLTKNTPDLIISDIMMPEMNGLEFVNTLRSKKQFKHLPVIFLSAKNEDLDVQTGLSTGADIYLTKPIRSKMLLTQIEAVLRRERILKKGVKIPLPEEPKLVTQVREIVYRQLGNPSLTVNSIADTLFISRAKLYAEWKEVNEITVNDFIKSMRHEEAKILLKERGFSVQETAYAVGFSDPNYFSTSFKKEFGESPTEYLKSKSFE